MVKYPRGLIFELALTYIHYRASATIVMAVSSCNISKSNIPYITCWSTSDNSALREDELKKPVSGGTLKLKAEHIPDITSKPFERMVSFLQAKGIEPLVWTADMYLPDMWLPLNGLTVSQRKWLSMQQQHTHIISSGNSKQVYTADGF